MYIWKSILFLICVGYLSILGQTTGYESGSATANLLMPLSIEEGNGNLDFGDIIISDSPRKEVLTPLNGKEFIVKGEANRSVTVNFDNVELNNFEWISLTGGQSGSLEFVPDVRVNNSQMVNSGEEIILNKNGLIGELKLNVGGSIDIKSSQPTGEYKGLFIISVSY